MQVTSEGGLPVSSIVWQSATGAWALTAVCKLTYRLEPGVASVADPQEPVNEEDNHWNDDDARSLVAPSDLAPFKPRADVLIVGHAFAPDRRPVRSVVARVCVGSVDKSIEVVCDRVFEQDGHVREGSPFVKMPLRYERASGGPGMWNPVGVPFDAAPDAYGRCAIANLQPPGTFVQWKGDTFGSVGFGPIAPGWPGRTERLHHHARRWSHRDWHARPLPSDLDLAYFNAAPADQQTDSIRPDERILLEHLHPSQPRLVTNLPGLVPRAEVERASGHRSEMELVADTLWIDTDRAICTVTWRGRIGLVHAREEGLVRVRVEGLHLRRAEPTLLADSISSSSPADATVTLMGGIETPSAPELPFESSPWRVSPLATPGADSPSPPDLGDAGATLFLSAAAVSPPATLPFAPAAGSAPAGPSPERSPAPVPYTAPAPSPPPVSPAAPPIGSAQTPLGAFSLRSLPVAVELDRTESAPLVPSSPDKPSLDPPAPPAMIGPLARPGMEPSPVMAAPLGLEKPSPGPSPAPKPPVPPAEPALDLESYPIERSARIAVSIACRPAEVPAILEQHELTAPAWERLKNHWLEAIRRDLAKGKPALMKRYDAAYVAQVEAERGPIGIEEYARLAVASERGTVGEAVTEMRLPSGAPMRIERVWMERMALDPAFGERVRAAVDEGRAA